MACCTTLDRIINTGSDRGRVNVVVGKSTRYKPHARYTMVGIGHTLRYHIPDPPKPQFSLRQADQLPASQPASQPVGQPTCNNIII